MRSSVRILAFALTCIAGCSHGARQVRSLAALRAAPLFTFNERETDAYLRWIRRARPDVLERVALLGRQNIGQPYRLYLLGEAPFELHDPDPLYCLSASDCVTFVEHTFAMALADDWTSFFRTLQRIRYRDGEIGILTRNHFTEADWNVNNAWLFEDITSSVGAGSQEPMRVTIDRGAFFARFGLDVDLPDEVFETTYIPVGQIEEVLPRLRDGDVVEIVRGESQAPYVGHMGLILHADDGTVTLLHSAEPAVREEPFADYIERYPGVLGAKFLRLLGPAEENSATASHRPS